MVTIQECLSLGYFTLWEVALDFSQVKDQMLRQKGLFIVGKESSKMICLNFVRHFVKSMAETRNKIY